MRYLFGDRNLLGDSDILVPERRDDPKMSDNFSVDVRGQTRFDFPDPPEDTRGNGMLFYLERRETDGRDYRSDQA